MDDQPFELLLEGEPSLLRRVEELVVDAHRRWFESSGQTGWSEPRAYRWLRYEDPQPVRRLAEGVTRLLGEVEFDSRAVDEATAAARGGGYGGAATAP